MNIGNLVKDLNKKYKTEIMSKGSHVLEMPRVPTGSFSLDVELGGGVPVGRITTISGEYGDGKTSIVLKIVSEYQKKFPNKEVVWIDAEGAWDNSWAGTLGVDVDRVYLVHPEYSQQAFDIAEQCISCDVGLLVIDSIAALVPKEEAEATMEEWQVGLAARINNKFIRRTHSSLNDKRGNDVPPTVILINQLRDAVGPFAGGPTEPGGKGIRFAASVRITTRRGDLYPKSKSNYDPDVVPKAQQIKFYVPKNKTAPPHTRGHVWFYFDTLDEHRAKGTYDRLEEIIRYARKHDIVQQSGSMYYIPDPQTGERKAFKGSNTLAAYIRENSETRNWIEKEVFRKVEAANDIGKKQEVLGADRINEDKGEESSQEDERETATRERLDSLVEGRRKNGRSPDPAQVDDEALLSIADLDS